MCVKWTLDKRFKPNCENQQDFAKDQFKSTHKRPVAKAPVFYNFFRSDICNLQTDGMGSTRIAKSDSTLNIPLASLAASL